MVFAIGETKQSGSLVDYIPTFTSQIQSAGNYIDAVVKQVETSTIDMSAFGAREIFNTWRKMPESTGRGERIWKLQESEGKIYAEGVKTLENRHTSTGIIDDSEDGFNTTDFKMSFTHNTKGPNGEATYRNVYNGWSPHISGAMFRYTETATGAWNSYMLVIGDCFTSYRGGTGIPYCAVVKIRNGDPDFLPGTYAGSLPIGWSAGVADTSGNLTHMVYEYQNKVYNVGEWTKGENKSRADMMLLQARAIVNTSSHDFRIECTGNNIKVYCGDILQLDVNDNDSPSYDKGTYGLYSYSSPNIYFSNFMVERGNTMSLGESLSDVSWRSEAARFVIHATDIVPDDFKDQDSAEYQYNVTKLLSSGAYLINIGINSNKNELNSLIDKLTEADGAIKGTFFEADRPNIEYALVRAKDYITDIARRISKPTDYALVGDKLIWDTQYADQEKDVPLNFGYNKDDIIISNTWGIGTYLMNKFKGEQILAEKWRYKHSETEYDNGMGKAAYSNVWIQKPIEVFDKSGLYRINYKRRDNPFKDDFSLSNAFDNYRYWSYDYDPIKSNTPVEKYKGVLVDKININKNRVNMEVQ